MKYFFLFSLGMLLIIRQGACQIENNLRFDNRFRDTNTYVILSFEEFKPKVIKSDSNAVDIKLNTSEIKLIEKLFFKGIEKHNREVDSIFKIKKNDYHPASDFVIPISERFYVKQLVPYRNNQGERKVYIFCFAHDYNSEDYFWKTFLVHMYDGGNSSFEMLINLTSKKIDFIEIGNFE